VSTINSPFGFKYVQTLCRTYSKADTCVFFLIRQAKAFGSSVALRHVLAIFSASRPRSEAAAGVCFARLWCPFSAHVWRAKPPLGMHARKNTIALVLSMFVCNSQFRDWHVVDRSDSLNIWSRSRIAHLWLSRWSTLLTFGHPCSSSQSVNLSMRELRFDPCSCSCFCTNFPSFQSVTTHVYLQLWVLENSDNLAEVDWPLFRSAWPLGRGSPTTIFPARAKQPLLSFRCSPHPPTCVIFSVRHDQALQGPKQQQTTPESTEEKRRTSWQQWWRVGVLVVEVGVYKNTDVLVTCM